MTTYYSASGLIAPPTMLVDAAPLIAPQPGGRQMLDMTGLGEVVVGAGKSKNVDFAVHSHIFTRGLFNCFAVCAVWDKDGGAFKKGFLAHISAPKHSFFKISLASIPKDAFVACGVGAGAWGAEIAQILEAHVPTANIWIYTRPNNDDHVGFGIDRGGRFGETLGKA